MKLSIYDATKTVCGGNRNFQFDGVTNSNLPTSKNKDMLTMVHNKEVIIPSIIKTNDKTS